MSRRPFPSSRLTEHLSTTTPLDNLQLLSFEDLDIIVLISTTSDSHPLTQADTAEQSHAPTSGGAIRDPRRSSLLSARVGWRRRRSDGTVHLLGRESFVRLLVVLEVVEASVVAAAVARERGRGLEWVQHEPQARAARR